MEKQELFWECGITGAGKSSTLLAFISKEIENFVCNEEKTAYAEPEKEG